MSQPPNGTLIGSSHTGRVEISCIYVLHVGNVDYIVETVAYLYSIENQVTYKLAPYGTGGRLQLTANFKVT